MAEETEPTEPGSDEQLIAAVRAGDPDAFETLYTRHVASARRLALALARAPADVDDLVAEAFATLLRALHDGGGPDVAFRAYLLTTVRNLFYDRTRRDQRVRVVDDMSVHDPGEPFEDPAVEGLERTLVARAFARLPERSQTVLWHTQVEGEKPAAVATMLGLEPNAVSVLAYRAREQLRQNYLREHITTAPPEQCRATVDRLGEHVRRRLSKRDRASVEGHLDDCRRCQVLFLELGDVNASLKTILGPVVLGETAAVAYLGAGSAGFAGPLAGVRQLARRRSVQVAAGTAVVAVALAAAAFALTGSPAEPEAAAPPGGRPSVPTVPAATGTAEPSPAEAPTTDPASEAPPDRGQPSPPAEEQPSPAEPTEPDQPDQPGAGEAADEDSPPPGGTPPPAASVPPPPDGEESSDPPDAETPPAGDDPRGSGICLGLELSLLDLELCLGLGG